MENGGWTTIGKTKHQKPAQNQKKTVVQDKKEPKKRVTKPLYSYEEFKLDEKPKKKQITKKIEPEVKPKAVPKPVKKTSLTANTKSRTLQDAIKKLNLSDLRGMVEKMRAHCPGKPVVWMLDVAQTLNLRLCPTVPSDSAYRGESGAPLAYYSPPILEYLQSLLGSFSDSVLAALYRQCCQTMLDDAAQGCQVHGCATLVMLLQQHHAATIMPQHHHLTLSCTHDTRAFLTHIWLLHSALKSTLAAGEPKVAVQLWRQQLAPHLSHKLVGDMVVAAAETLVGGAPPPAAPALLAALLPLAHPASTATPRPITRRLAALLPRLRTALSTDAAAVEVFGAVALPGVCRSRPVAYRAECSGLCASLLKREAVLEQWLELLPSHVTNSTLLLKQLNLATYPSKHLNRLFKAVKQLDEGASGVLELKRLARQRAADVPASPSRVWAVASHLLFRALSFYVILSLCLVVLLKYELAELPGPFETLAKFNSKYLSVTKESLDSGVEWAANKFPEFVALCEEAAASLSAAGEATWEAAENFFSSGEDR